MQVWLAVLTMAAAVASLDSAAAQAALPILGAGNVGTNGGKVSNDTLAELDALKALGASSCRTNLYPGSYIKAPNHWDTPVPESMDEFMTAAMARGIRPVVLFEYYAPQVRLHSVAPAEAGMSCGATGSAAAGCWCIRSHAAGRHTRAANVCGLLRSLLRRRASALGHSGTAWGLPSRRTWGRVALGRRPTTHRQATA